MPTIEGYIGNCRPENFTVDYSGVPIIIKKTQSIAGIFQVLEYKMFIPINRFIHISVEFVIM
jgi:hypothetical protein